MKILIEIPDNWLDSNKLDDLAFITRTCKQEVQKRLMDIAVDKALKEIKVPKIKLDEKEIKRILLDKITDKMVQTYNHER